MTNYEFYQHGLAERILEHGYLIFAVVNNEVVDCYGTDCTKCLFRETGKRCSDLRKERLNAEYEEPITAKSMQNAFRKFCGSIPNCRGCEFETVSDGSCKFAWILKNYNVTKKGGENNDKP